MLDNKIDEFVYSASHDLQAPIRNAKSFAKLLNIHLEQASVLDSESQEYLDIITSSVERMEKLVDNLREYFTITNKGGKQQFSLDSYFGLLQLELEKAHPEINLNLEIEKSPQLEASPDMIKLAFRELIDNAIKFKSSENVDIKITYSETPSNWEFQVSDNGIGIKEEFESEIFKPFSKFHQNNGIGGSGLGLATFKKIVEFHDGEIAYKKNPTGGSIFNFSISKPLQTDIQERQNGQRNTLAT